MLRGVVLLGLIVLLAAPAPASAGVPRDWLGVVVDGPLTDSHPQAPDQAVEWDRIGASGAASIRMPLYWRAAQNMGPQAPVLAGYDDLVLSAANRGLPVVPVVLGTPDWAAVTPGDLASPPRDPEDFGRFLTALVDRYGPRGSLWREHREVRAQPIRAWQIWNEPQLAFYWSQQPFETGYVPLLKAARRALRRADPRAKLVLGGLTNESWKALSRIYRAGGRGSFDAVAIHPYTARPRNVIRILRIVRAVMRRHGDGRKPLWVTELSWSAGRGMPVVQYGFETDERGQARRLRAALLRLAAVRRRLRVERVYWYTWISYEGHFDSFGWSGLRRLRGDGSVVSAPALRVFRRLARRLPNR